MERIRFLLSTVVLLSFFASCSPDVEFYADYKDVTIIYAMLNVRDDTNYVKINRAFCGTNDNPIDATEVALIADSSNYPGKLDAYIIELKSTFGGSYEETGRVFQLDTMTIHDKEIGTFYAPEQKIYYTAEQFYTGTDGDRYKYKLVVVKPNGDTLTALTSMVGNEDFAIVSKIVNFQKAPSNAMMKILFKADGVAPLYDIKMQFNYLEQLEGQEMKRKHVSRTFGTKALDLYDNIGNNLYYLEYGVNWLFGILKNTIGGDTIIDAENPNVVRYIDDFIISISAAGEELAYHYYATQNQLNNPLSVVTPCINIDGGYGLFSSRTTITKVVKLSNGAIYDLLSQTSWGFKEQ